MLIVTSKGRRSGDGNADSLSNQGLAESHPVHLRNLVLNYLCHNCYLKTAEAFAKDSTVRHLDKDGNEIPDKTTPRTVGNELRTIGSEGPSTDLSNDMIRNILLRQRIRSEVLSGNVQEAIVLLNQHFPIVLSEDNIDNQIEVTNENVNSSRFEYIAETVNPVHLSLNLRILAFIEACRTIPLIYVPPTLGTESPTSTDVHTPITPTSPITRDPKDEENHQSELLICIQKLYATVNALHGVEDRAIYLRELHNVGGLLAYTIPEKSPMAKYLHQGRRDRVAEQVNSAILHHTNMPSVSYLELAVRYTHCLWAMLHELRVKVPPARHLSGVFLPSGTGESEKELPYDARPFDLQLFLNTKT